MTTGKRAVTERPRFKDLADAMAVKHLANGQADEEAQQRAFQFIVREVLQVGQTASNTENTHDMAAACALQDAARELINYRDMPAEDLKAILARRAHRKVKNA